MDANITELLTFAGANNATSFNSDKSVAWTGQGGAKLSTSSPLYAPSSGLISASGDYFRTLAGAPFKLGAGDFTAEVWFQTTDEQATLIDADSDAGGFCICLNGPNSLFFFSSTGDYLETFTNPFSQVLADGALHYVNFTRQGGTLSCWVDQIYYFYAEAASSFNYAYTPSAVNLGRRIADPSSRPMTSAKFGGVRITVGGVRFPLGDDIPGGRPSPYDATGGGGIVEATATFTADSSSNLVAARLRGAVASLSGDAQLAPGGQRLLGANAVIIDNTVGGIPYVPPCGPETQYFPTGAYRVTVANRANLQTLLDSQGVIRLDAGNYAAAGGIAELVLKPGQAVYGVPGPGGTQIPPVTVQAGCTGATLKGVSADSFNFPASASVTKQNCFGMTAGNFVALGATLEQNLFASTSTQVRFDNTSGGWMRNNRWIRTHSHGAGLDGRAAFLQKGGAGRTSYGNVIIGYNALGAFNAGLEVIGQQDFSVVGFDEESYYAHADGKAALHVRDTGTLNVIGVGGSVVGNDGIDSGADATNIIFHDMNASDGGVRIKLQATAAATAIWKFGNYTPTDLATGALRLTEGNKFQLTVNGTTPASLIGANAAAALGLLTYAVPSTSAPWGFPVERAVPDPAGPSWNVGLGARADEAPALQALMNANLIVELEPRAYYIGTTLTSRPGQKLIGVAGATVIIAKATTLDMLRPTAAEGTSGLTLIDIVFQGGRTGIHQNTPGLQLNEFDFVHATFRDMTLAGIFLEDTYAWDNGWLEYCNFYNCASGVRQRGTGDAFELTISYIDKANFFRCQFIQCGLGIDFQCGRPNNLDTWTECLFKDCTNSAYWLVGLHNYATFTNCHFLNNGGTVACDGKLNRVAMVGCRILGSVANTYLVSQQSLLEGCVFERGAGSALLMDLAPVGFTESFLNNAGIFNCSSMDVPLGAIDSSPARISLICINSSFPSVDDRWSKPISAIQYDSKSTPFLGDDTRGAQFGWLEGSVTPGTRFLRDSGVPGTGTQNVLFTATAVGAAVATMTGAGDIAGISGAIRAGTWAASADGQAAWVSNLIASGEAEMMFSGAVDVEFDGSAIAAAVASIETDAPGAFASGAIVSAEAALEAAASFSPTFNFTRSAVATLVGGAITVWRLGSVPGSGVEDRPAGADRRMMRNGQDRRMARPSISRSMTR